MPKKKASQLGQVEFSLLLEDSEIDWAASKIATYLTAHKVERREALKLRLSFENILLTWRDMLGDKAKVEVSTQHHMGNNEINLTCVGEKCNPLDQDEDALGGWVGNLRASMESAPSYSYFRKTNKVTFVLRKKASNGLLRVMAFLLAGILIGFAGRWIPSDVRLSICDIVFEPLYNAYLTIISFCGIPLIFLSVVTGVLGVGNLRTFTLIGKGMVKRCAIIILVVTLAAIGIALPIFSLQFGNNAVAVSYKDFVDLLLDCVPEGIFQPFISCNAIQIIVLSFLIAIALLMLNGGSGALVNMINDANIVFLKISSWLTCLIPFLVTVMIVKSMWVSEAAVLLSAWKSWVATTGAQLAFIVICVLVLCVRHHAGFLTICRKLSKTFLIALGTNTCTASIGENYACCAKMGIDDKVFTFGIPIGTTIYKPATAIRLVLLCFFMANSEGLTISVGWLLMLCILCIAFSVAIPAIPGGTIMFCSMLFSQLGIPTEVIAQMLATDIFFDSICTAFNQISVPLLLGEYAGTIGYLDADMLKM